MFFVVNIKSKLLTVDTPVNLDYTCFIKSDSEILHCQKK